MNRVQIRVSTVDLGARRANSTTGNFSIVKGNGQTGDTQAPIVSFLSPKGGERFTSGDSLPSFCQKKRKIEEIKYRK
ncbi:MAG: hypothetical protein HY819_22845 [Acidobacteria bacterium]|nr:hypothetical protein [Acidobacteriota bacterium]